MTSEQWQQVKDVLDRALDLPMEERPIFLDFACSSDHSLRQHVESLLKASQEVPADFLHSSIPAAHITPGMKLGQYEVAALIGSGGMGEVYRAHDSRLHRDV